MQYIIYFIFICIIIFIIFLNRKKSVQQAKEFDQLIENYKQNGINKYIQENKEKLEFEIRYDLKRLEEQRDQVSAEIVGKQTALQEISSKVKIYEEQLRDMALINAKQYEETLMNIVKDKVKTEQEKMQKAAQESFEKTMAEMDVQAEAARTQIETLTKEIAEYSAKQIAINEAILRQRALEEQQDFYRVCLGPEAANDVEILKEARRNLKKPEIIDKIIYDNYIAKPVLEMIKRVLQNTTCSGIYKITCQETNEIYIGKSTDIKNRWQQHCKTAFNCGTIASSLLHKKMQQYGIENFTFELLEVVPKDKLSEREKFYIDFYKTKETGLNERNG